MKWRTRIPVKDTESDFDRFRKFYANPTWALRKYKKSTGYTPKCELDKKTIWNIYSTFKLLIGKETSYRKIFAIGLNKTATTSIHTGFMYGGFRATHSQSWRHSQLEMSHFCFQAFSDGGPSDIGYLDRMFPKSVFILNTRNLDEWLDSRLEHIKFDLASKTEFVDHGSWGLSQKAIKKSIIERQDFHLAVLKYFQFRPDDLLLINYIRDLDASTKISNLIGGYPVNENHFARPTPKLREAGVLKNGEAIDEAMKSLGIPEPEWKYDLLCPSLLSESDRNIWLPDTGMRID